MNMHILQHSSKKPLLNSGSVGSAEGMRRHTAEYKRETLRKIVSKDRGCRMLFKNRIMPFVFIALAFLLLAGKEVYALNCGTLLSSINTLITSCIPVNIVNTQSTATSGNFQEMLNLPFNALTGDLVVYNGLSGNLMPTWVESNGIAWVNLGANTIAASSSANGIYYIGINSGTNFFISGNEIGEAPQLPAAYGEYDNGANVFTIYFNGNVPTSSFTLSGSGSSVSAVAVAGPTGATINALKYLEAANKLGFIA